MTIRVAQVSTGNAGKLTLRQLIADDRFELVAVSTSSADKVGKDAGELAGVATITGITARCAAGSPAEGTSVCGSDARRTGATKR